MRGATTKNRRMPNAFMRGIVMVSVSCVIIGGLMAMVIAAVGNAKTTTTEDQRTLPEIEDIQMVSAVLGYQETAEDEYVAEACSAEAEMLARLVWGEARGVKSETEQAAVIWCVLNRVDSDEFPNSIREVVLQPNQFVGYSEEYPLEDKFLKLAEDVIVRWISEVETGDNTGRVLPAEYLYFSGDGKNNHFRTELTGGDCWDWSLPSPYGS